MAGTERQQAISGSRALATSCRSVSMMSVLVEPSGASRDGRQYSAGDQPGKRCAAACPPVLISPHPLQHADVPISFALRQRKLRRS